MSVAEAQETKQADPMENFRELRDAYLEIWSKNFIEAVNTEGYAQASGAALDTLLSVTGPQKELAEQTMLRTLQQLNMPSSVDFAGLAGRLTNIEMQLDNLDAKLDRIEKLISRMAAVASTVPSEPTETSSHADSSAKTSAENSMQAELPIVVKRAAPKKQPAPRTRKIPKQVTTAKAQRRNARKETK
jgi:hypothetical protein